MRVLAIGDGYNDTQMLLASDVGIRIVKQVSRQKKAEQPKQKAVVADADFIISNFFQIEKLVFAHGFQSNRQISQLIYFYIYKNVVLVGSEIVFQVLSAFSRQRFFLGILDSSYNTVLSTLQAFVIILFERRRFNEPL